MSAVAWRVDGRTVTEEVWIVSWENVNRSYYKPKTEKRLYMSEKTARGSYTWHLTAGPAYENVKLYRSEASFVEVEK
jgi:hypothetical protein